MPVVYYSPITFLFWYDTPSLYRGEPELEFWKQVPATWDETVPLDGQIGEYVAIARRKGDKWFVGVMNGLEQRQLTLATDFLEKGKKYTIVRYEDDPSMKTRTNIRITRQNIKGGEKLKLDLLASGGAALEIHERE